MKIPFPLRNVQICMQLTFSKLTYICIAFHWDYWICKFQVYWKYMSYHSWAQKIWRECRLHFIHIKFCSPRSISDTDMVNANCEKLQMCNTWSISGGSATVKLWEHGKTLHLYSITTHTYTLTGQAAMYLQVHSAADKCLVKYRWKREILLSDFLVKK